MAADARSRRRWWWLGGVFLVLAAAITAALVVTSQPSFCRSCHLMETRYVSWERSAHADEADCLDCHAEPGPWGEVKAHLNGARYLYVLVTGREQVILRAEVPEGTCVQCHAVRDLPEGSEGVDIAHENHYRADVPCETCHAGFHDDIGGGAMPANLDGCTECHAGSILFGREGRRREPR